MATDVSKSIIVVLASCASFLLSIKCKWTLKMEFIKYLLQVEGK